jgi:hypothetical protein
MGSYQGFHWIILGVIFLLPAILVMFSSKVHGFEKAGWALVALFLSWIGFAVFMTVQALRPSPLKP